ncbi:spider silk-constituting element SpiCE-NMa1 [Nephila pilipes]|uniref:Spider silk-constituting element SpiCE-NMa1 n=1 Tax=Nephila pilipes TaxID=299642 RepID=A0A8X6R2I0_NEPPI|nr:spider silk-constituting element SpiCE-NMa1 [Nephila pilipes]
MSKILTIFVVFATLSYTSSLKLKRFEKYLALLGPDGLECDGVANLIKSMSSLIGTVKDAGGVMQGALGDFKDDLREAINDPNVRHKLRGLKGQMKDIGNLMGGMSGNLKDLGSGLQDLGGSMKGAFGPPVLNLLGNGYSMMDNLAGGGTMDSLSDIFNNARDLGGNMMSMDGAGDLANEIFGDLSSGLGPMLGNLNLGGLGEIGIKKIRNQRIRLLRKGVGDENSSHI